jgi:hypothetical protein
MEKPSSRSCIFRICLSWGGGIFRVGLTKTVPLPSNVGTENGVVDIAVLCVYSLENIGGESPVFKIGGFSWNGCCAA